MSLTNEDLQKIGDLMEKKLNEKIPKLMTEFWEKTMLPWFEKYYVTKEELERQFQGQSLQIAEEFQLVREEITNLDYKVNRLAKRVDDVDKHVIALHKSHTQHVEETKQKFSAHTNQFRKIYGVSEPLPTYQVEEKLQK